MIDARQTRSSPPIVDHASAAQRLTETLSAQKN